MPDGPIRGGTTPRRHGLAVPEVPPPLGFWQFRGLASVLARSQTSVTMSGFDTDMVFAWQGRLQPHRRIGLIMRQVVGVLAMLGVLGLMVNCYGMGRISPEGHGIRGVV